MFDQNDFNNFVLENNVIKHFDEPVTFVSGRKSNYYVNWRSIDDVERLDKLSNLVIEFARSKNLNPDCFYGIPEGATRMALITQYNWSKINGNNKSLPMGRGKVKDHGDPHNRHFITKPSGKVVVLEDVVSVGTNIIPALENLVKNGIEVEGVVVLIEWGFEREDGRTAREVIESMGIPYYAIANANDLVSIIKQ